MTTVFFSYFLRDRNQQSAFEDQILSEVAPDALAHSTVESWVLHRTIPWPGVSFESPDYVCVVEVTDVRGWSRESADSISVTHGALGPLVSRIDMAIADDVAAHSP